MDTEMKIKLLLIVSVLVTLAFGYSVLSGNLLWSY